MTMRHLILATAMLSMLTVRAQDSSWVHVSYPAYDCSWQMPGAPTMLDTLGVRMYSLELDSNMAIAVHFMQDVMPDTTLGSLYQAAFDVEGDTLRAMAQVMLFLTGSELLAITDTTIGEVSALDLTFGTPVEAEPVEQLTRFRIIFHERKFMTFTVTGPKFRSLDVIALGNALCDTIHIAEP